MKKTLLALSVVFGLGINLIHAQTPENKSRSVVLNLQKPGGPCGSWGWNLGNQVIGDMGDDAYYVGVMGSSTPASMNANCYSAFAPNYPIGGYPTFVVNDVDAGTSLSSIRSVYSAFAVASPVASPAGYISVSASEISVSTKTKFWAAAEGEFHLAAFVIEDKVQAEQNGQSGIVEHHYLMRGSMDPNLIPWGKLIASGSIAADAEYTHSFSMTYDSNSWESENISVLLILYKEGTSYKFVNAVKAKPAPTSIVENNSIANIAVYPNPANLSGATLELSLEKNEVLNISVLDVTGREVYTIHDANYKQGKSMVNIPTSNLANGVYNIKVQGNSIMKNERLIVNN